MIRDQSTIFRVAYNLIEKKHKMDVFTPFCNMKY